MATDKTPDERAATALRGVGKLGVALVGGVIGVGALIVGEREDGGTCLAMAQTALNQGIDSLKDAVS